MTTEPDLLPCPFCGGEAHLERQGHVCCKTMFCRGAGAFDNYGTPTEQNASAVSRWNTRANVAHATAAKDAEIEALRAEVDRLMAIAGWGGLAGDAPERIILASEMFDGLRTCDKWLDVRRVIDDGKPLPESATAYVRADRAERLAEALREVAEYEGDPSTPVRNSVKKSAIARAALNPTAAQADEAAAA